MVPDLSKISGIGNYERRTEKERELFFVKNKEDEEKVFLVVNKHTFELRCDNKLAELLKGKYESVMESRYFGRNGIELVPAGQLSDEETGDLIRLSYDLTKEDK